jgi:hypothetical protein
MRKVLFAAAATAALASVTASAQNTDNPSTNKMTAPEATQTTAPAPDASNPPASQASNAGANYVQIQSSDMLTSNIVGLDIHNAQNDNIGKLQDIAFDPSHKLAGYILSVGGFLGMGVHYVAVSPDALMVSYDSQNKVWKATMNATKDELKAAPEFKYGGQWTASKS